MINQIQRISKMTSLKDKAFHAIAFASVKEGVMSLAAKEMQSDPSNTQKMDEFNRACNAYKYADDAAKAAVDAANGVSYD
jgi:hypothetical protein